MEELSHTTDRVAFAAVIDDQVVGWIDAAMERHLQYAASAVIGGLVVREDMRGFGVGSRLCLEVEEWARSKSVPLVRVRSQIKREDAHRFYLRDGYSKVKTSVGLRKAGAVSQEIRRGAASAWQQALRNHGRSRRRW